MLHRLCFRSCCCCISLEKGCSVIGALEWMLTVYLSCKYYDITNPGCKARDFKISCSMIYYNVLSFVISVAVISGVNKKSRMYFIPWLLSKTIEYMTFNVILIYDFKTRVLLTNDIVFPIIFIIITMLIFWYSWFCVLSLYIHMGHEKDGDQDDSQLQELV